MKPQTFEFTAVVRGRLTVDSKLFRKLQGRVRTRESFAQAATSHAIDTVTKIAPPGIGPLVMDQVRVSLESIKFVS